MVGHGGTALAAAITSLCFAAVALLCWQILQAARGIEHCACRLSHDFHSTYQCGCIADLGCQSMKKKRLGQSYPAGPQSELTAAIADTHACKHVYRYVYRHVSTRSPVPSECELTAGHRSVACGLSRRPLFCRCTQKTSSGMPRRAVSMLCRLTSSHSKRMHLRPQ